MEFQDACEGVYLHNPAPKADSCDQSKQLQHVYGSKNVMVWSQTPPLGWMWLEIWSNLIGL